MDKTGENKSGDTETNIFKGIRDGRDKKGITPESSPLKNAPISKSPVNRDELDDRLSEMQRKVIDVNKRWFGF